MHNESLCAIIGVECLAKLLYNVVMQLIVILLLLLVVSLASLSFFLFFYYLKINKLIGTFLEKGKVRDVREVLFSQIEKTKQIDLQLKEIDEKIRSLEDIARVSVQKIGVVRFNPFSDMGGNQSFAISLLDSNNDGFVLSSLFIKEGNRVYAKAVINGVSEHTLSNEEKQAIERAIKK